MCEGCGGGGGWRSTHARDGCSTLCVKEIRWVFGFCWSTHMFSDENSDTKTIHYIHFGSFIGGSGFSFSCSMLQTSQRWYSLMTQVKAKDGMNDYLDDKWDVRTEAWLGQQAGPGSVALCVFSEADNQKLTLYFFIRKYSGVHRLFAGQGWKEGHFSAHFGSQEGTSAHVLAPKGHFSACFGSQEGT